MLTIRMQRTGRSGLANFRVVVQDSRFSPGSGRVVALLGNYNPHTKESTLDKVKAEVYLKNGAQPSPRVVKLLKEEKVTIPSWVKDIDVSKKRTTRNPEKLRKNQPKEVSAVEPEVETEQTTVDETVQVEEQLEQKDEDNKVEPKIEETVSEETSTEEKPAEA